ncbi:MAG: sensor histidine kinase [Cyclobacteriaceae bacterium]
MSLITALLGSVLITGILYWLGLVIEPNWWLVAVAIFVLGFVITFAVLELVIFRKIRKVMVTLKLIGVKEPEESSIGYNGGSNLDMIRDTILSFARFKQQEIDQLKNTAEYRREFLADVSHELKTPIFAAQGFVHTLLDGAVEDTTVRNKFLKKAAKSLDGLDLLVQDLLTLSRLENRQITMDFENFNIYELAQEVFEQLEEKAMDKGIKLQWGSGVFRGIIVYADYHRIQQVLLNLVSNAINYTPSGGSVNIDFEVKKDVVVVHVKDTGQGISSEHLDRIFERFYRVEKSRAKSKDKRGSGLGLAIVKHILEMHQSQIQVKSTKGKGSDFYFELSKQTERA